MTLARDKKKPQRPPMRRWVFVTFIAVAVAVLAFVFIVLAVSGKPLF